MHGKNCLMDSLSAGLTLLLFALFTLMLCEKQHIWHNSNRQLPDFDMFLHLMSLNMHRMWCRGCLSCTILTSISPWQNGLWWLVLSLASLLSVCPICICCACGPPSAVFWSSFSASSPLQYHVMTVRLLPGPHKSTTAVLNFVSFKLLHVP